MNILVFLHSRKHFGAQIVHIPALQAIRKKHPSARIVGVAKFDHALALHELGYVDEIHIGSGFDFLISVVKKYDFSESYSFRPTSFTVDILTALFGIKKRYAFRKGFFGSIKYSKEKYRAKAFYELVNHSEMFYEECCRSVAEKYKTEVARENYFLLIPGAGGKEKRWGINKYLELAQKIKNQTQCSVKFLFGPEEKEEVDYVQSKSNFQCVISPRLNDLFHLVVSSRVVISGDCGPAHVAHVTNAAQVVLFINVLNEWFEYRNNSIAITGGVGLEGIAVDMVLSLIKGRE